MSFRRSTRIVRQPVRYSPSITSLEGEFDENSVEEGELSEVQSGFDTDDTDDDATDVSEYTPLTQEMESSCYSDSDEEFSEDEMDEIDEEMDEDIVEFTDDGSLFGSV
jgi:hypothetical protein